MIYNSIKNFLTTKIKAIVEVKDLSKCIYTSHGLEVSILLSAAAVTAKSLQSCPTLCDPIDGSPPGFPIPRILQARILEWVAISFSDACKWKVKVKSLSCVQLLVTPCTTAYKAPPFMGFSRARVLEWGAIAFSEYCYQFSSNCSINSKNVIKIPERFLVKWIILNYIWKCKI